MAEFRMPSLGADMDFGTVVEWLVKPGQRVHKGDIVAVVDTEKADVEVEIFESGIVGEILVPVGQKVPVGTVLALVEVEGEAEPVGAPELAVEAAPTPRIRVAPRARRRAQELGVDLTAVVGSGEDGSITVEDVERSAGPEVSAAPRERREAMRRAIGDLMARSKREIPHYYLSHHVDMGAALAWLERENASRSVEDRLIPAVLLLKAAAVAVGDVPQLNGLYVDGSFQPSEGVHLGVAISLRGGGLIAPAIHDADQQGVDELMRSLRDLVTRARSGRLRSSEMSDPTITVTNLGEHGVEAVFGVIYPPQVALVGFGAITEQARVSQESVSARPVVQATLSADHRVTEGQEGARYLSAVERILQAPEEL